MTGILQLPHGIHENYPEEEYHRPVLGMISMTALSLFADTPSKYAAYIAGFRKPETPALSFGKACHMALLEPERFAATFVIEPDFGSCRKNDATGTSSEQAKENKTRRDAWRAEHKGATILYGEDGKTTLGMIKRIAERRPYDPPAAALIEGGLPEVTLRWQDKNTGLECRARADVWQEELRAAPDFKSIRDASPDGFSRAATEFRYHWIEALYRSGFRTLGKPIESYPFVAQEKVYPFDFGVYYLDAEAVLKGIDSIERQMDRMLDCLEREEWPGYSRHFETVSLKPWTRE